MKEDMRALSVDETVVLPGVGRTAVKFVIAADRRRGHRIIQPRRDIFKREMAVCNADLSERPAVDIFPR
jgi:hypothetical protein